MKLLALRQTLMVWLELWGGDNGKSAQTKYGHEQAKGSKVREHGFRGEQRLSGPCNADIRNTLAW